MGRLPPVEEEEVEAAASTQQQKLHELLLSCWGRLRPASLWRRQRRCTSRRRRCRLRVKRCSFKYDPLSYSQNFDDGGREEEAEEGGYGRVFSLRIAAIHPPTPSSA
ncbi:unnamed protein product [Musa textilis]